MKNIVLTLYVNPAAAIREGHAACDDVRLELTDDDVKLMSESDRELLARHVAKEPANGRKGPQWGDKLTHDAPPIGRASLANVCALLRFREAAITEYAQLLKEELETTHRSLLSTVDRCRTLPLSELKDVQVGIAHSYVSDGPIPSGLEALADLSQQKILDITGRRDEWLAYRAGIEAKKEADAAERKAREIAINTQQKGEVLAVLKEHNPGLALTFAAGVAHEDHVEEALREHCVELLGLPPNPGGISVSAESKQMSPHEFLALGELRKRLAAFPQVTLVQPRNFYRPAKDDEGGDKDGEVLSDETAVRIETRIGGFELAFDRKLSQFPAPPELPEEASSPVPVPGEVCPAPTQHA